MKHKTRLVFVVLTYRNHSDLQEFISSLVNIEQDYHVIVVNSYFDEESKNNIETIATSNHCTFLNVPNNGYSSGNNRGIEYANQYFEYEYLIVSNADIMIEKLPIDELDSLERGIYAPQIIALRGVAQNPMLVIENPLSDWLMYRGFKSSNKWLTYSGIALNKIIRETWRLLFKGKVSKIFQPHGSFLIFSRESIQRLGTVFDENVFLMGEEFILAKKAKLLSLPVFYTPKLNCLHKEDGSIDLFSGNLQEEYRKSMIYFYENYCQRKRED